ncbi:hypothetical protein KFE25_006028 [Diacronema lutheri]|uniref:BZIP domain-containing protein n=1 Tax=Diacronema lutheri TaxID=2081491 RepID=A0A8J5XQ64_DIALT|nr:hypothetical protein KFE25_006028 [Diacronema lutheri]
MGDTAPDKFVRRNSTLEAIESLGASDLVKVKEHVDDDLLSCFLWAAGENAMNQSGWESPKGGGLAPEIESREILLGSLPDAPISSVTSPPGAKPGTATRSNGGVVPSTPEAALPSAAAATAGDAAAGAGSASAGDAAVPARPEAAAAAPGAAPAGGASKGKEKRKSGGEGGDTDDSGGSSDDDDDPNAVGPLGTPLTKESKLLQRMQRKAESARIARLRKKDYVSGLEDQVKELQDELKALERQLEETPAAAPATAAAGAPPGASAAGAAVAGALRPPAAGTKEEVSAMDALLRRPSVERLTPEIQSTIEKYVKNKRQRFDQISIYLDGIEEILQPGTAVQLAFGQSASLAAANSQPSDGGPLTKKHRRDSSAGSHLLEVLSSELGLTAEQKEQLAVLRDSIRKDREILVESEAIIKELRARVAEHIQSSQGITDGLRRILTPQQIAKFLTWVEKNHKSMDMLNSFDWEMQHA